MSRMAESLKETFAEMGTIKTIELNQPEFKGNGVIEIKQSDCKTFLNYFIHGNGVPAWELILEDSLARNILLAEIILMPNGKFVPGVNEDNVEFDSLLQAAIWCSKRFWVDKPYQECPNCGYSGK